MPIEKDAACIYTRAMYERFSKELFKSGAYACGDGDEDGLYRVVLISGRADQGLTEYRVAVSPDRTEYFCQCKMFEHSGMPCRHVLRVRVAV